MKSSHKFDLGKNGVKSLYPAGNRILANCKTAASLRGMALATICLKKGGFREPHWHPNADELTYCSKGKALVTIFSPGNKHDTFTLEAGELVFFPKGYIHHLENISPGESHFILAYDHDDPQDLNLSSSIRSMPIEAMAATFNVDKKTWQKLLSKKREVFIGKCKSMGGPAFASISNPHKINLERIRPQIETPGGLARIANNKSFALLEHMALFSLRIFEGGIREPHWHPNAVELNYVINGRAKLTIFSPGGHLDTFELLPNQGSIIPAGYFHYIENIGKEELHMAVYFNHPKPDDIGISGALSAYSKEILAGVFTADPKLVQKLPKIQEDRMIVCGGG